VIIWLLPEISKQQLGFDEINVEQFFMSIFELNLADSVSSGSLRPGFQDDHVNMSRLTNTTCPYSQKHCSPLFCNQWLGWIPATILTRSCLDQASPGYSSHKRLTYCLARLASRAGMPSAAKSSAVPFAHLLQGVPLAALKSSPAKLTWFSQCPASYLTD
jgi:hypothetical protein